MLKWVQFCSVIIILSNTNNTGNCSFSGFNKFFCLYYETNNFFKGSAVYFQLVKDKCCDASLYYFANVVDKEKVLLPSPCHLRSSVKATVNKTNP